MRKIYTLVLLFVFAIGISQNLKGKIYAPLEDLENINVINRTNESFAVSKKDGTFEITAKAGDELVFSAVNLVPRRITLTKEDFQDFKIHLQLDVRTLDVVRSNQNNNISAVGLGILQKPAKHYTPAERRLKTAGDFKFYQLLLIPLGGMPFDPVLNAISGRTAMLKKEVETEKKQFALEKLKTLYPDEYLIQTLKIPSDYCSGFRYYLVEDMQFRTMLKSGNKIETDFLITQLAVKYKEIIATK